MYLYLRVMPDADTDDLERDLPQIQTAVAQVEGAALAHKDPKPHPRGGYALFFECKPDARESLAQALYEHGFRPCY